MKSDERPAVAAGGRLVCPRCGGRMNFHAEKIDSAAAFAAAPDETLGGVLVEFHACPACGYLLERLASGQR